MGCQWEQNLHDYMRCLIISKILRDKKWSCSHRTSETIPIAMAGICCLGLGFGGKVGSCPQACNLPEPCWGCEIQARCIGQLVTAIPFSIQRNENTTKVLTKGPMTFESKVQVDVGNKSNCVFPISRAVTCTVHTVTVWQSQLRRLFSGISLTSMVCQS